ncbi:hypothetical protein CJA_3109 [Cellvibrio japonicus Ueda107]|uniref:Uncharacterized protein n=1 Tax=Cellvibrio japonicus (strain Ueda107) TaxID=498211 RepID=B3PDF1_CELJU|nr:hypothetical protein CJA_3109 [Cellvibrio japonicus Ueda107]
MFVMGDALFVPILEFAARLLWVPVNGANPLLFAEGANHEFTY